MKLSPLMLRTNTKEKGLIDDDNTILGNCIITLLKPFEEVTKTIISENSCLPDEIPLDATMKAALNAAIKSKGLSKVTETLMLEMDSRFQNLQNDYASAIVTFLNPRYKTKFLEPRVSQRVKIYLVCLCDEMLLKPEISPPNKKKKIAETDIHLLSVRETIAESMNVLLASSSDEESCSEVSKDTLSLIEDCQKRKLLESAKDPLV